MTPLNYLEIETGANPTASIIWLHGLGASGHDFEDLVPTLSLDQSMRFIFPHAPEIPVTANGGYIMRAWYDILEMTVERRINTEHLHESVLDVWQLIHQEIERGIPSERIILAGFSQGGAVAYQAALNFTLPLAGLLTMSTYIADAESLNNEEPNKDIPILIQHGSYDPVVLEQQGIKAYDHLRQLGYNVSYQNYPMEHHLCDQQVKAINSWLNEVLC